MVKECVYSVLFRNFSLIYAATFKYLNLNDTNFLKCLELSL